MAKEVNPKLVFDRLFAGGSAGESSLASSRRDFYRDSILDYVSEDANRLKGRLGTTDRRKLDEYLDSVREVEQRLNMAERPGGSARRSHSPGRRAQEIRRARPVDARHDGPGLPGRHRPASARSCSPTRARTAATERSAFPTGTTSCRTTAVTTRSKPRSRKINTFHIEQFAYLLGKLRDIKEGDGTVLDHTMVIHGSGIGDGNRHNHNDLPIVMAGHGCGTVKPGRHVEYPRNTPLNNLFLSMLDRMDAPVDVLGDSKGRLEGLES